MRTIGPWRVNEDGNCRIASFTEETSGRSGSGIVIERKPCFGLRNAECRRTEILLDLKLNTEELASLNDEALYDDYGRQLTVVSRTKKTITAANRFEDTFRIPLSKFKDGEAYHGKHCFAWGHVQRAKLQAVIENAERYLAQAEANCVKWRQRLEDDPDSWYAD